MVSLALFAQNAGKKPTADANKTIKVDVDLVTVNATVTDTQNRVITGLDKQNFRIWEDKVEQKLEYFSAEDVPVSIGLIFDISGSMKDKINTSREAAVTFLKLGNSQDEYFLETFSSRPQVAEDFTTDIARLQNKNYIKKILAREQFLLLNSTQYKFTSSFVDNLKIDAVFTVTPFHRQEDILLRV